MCGEYIDIIPSNIPQMKIAVSQWTARFHILRKPEECWCLLRNLSLDCLTAKYFQDFPRTFPKFQKKFQDFPELLRTLFKFQEFPGLSKIGGTIGV